MEIPTLEWDMLIIKGLDPFLILEAGKMAYGKGFERFILTQIRTKEVYIPLLVASELLIIFPINQCPLGFIPPNTFAAGNRGETK